LAKTDWETAIAEADGGGTPRSRGPWRLLTGVISVVAATLGLGYYWPLLRSERLLTTEYAALKQQAAVGSEQLTQASAALQTLTTERDDLLQRQHELDAKASHHKDSLERLVAGISQRFQQALDRQKLRAEQLPERVQIEILDPSTFTSTGDSLTASGHKLVCALGAEIRQQGSFRLVVRGFAAPTPTTGGQESRWAAPALKAGAVAEALTARCPNPSAEVEVVMSVGRAVGEPPRLEIYPAKRP
jgi:flagellar motor protein MotB